MITPRGVYPPALGGKSWIQKTYGKVGASKSCKHWSYAQSRHGKGIRSQLQAPNRYSKPLFFAVLNKPLLFFLIVLRQAEIICNRQERIFCSKSRAWRMRTILIPLTSREVHSTRGGKKSCHSSQLLLTFCRNPIILLSSFDRRGDGSESGKSSARKPACTDAAEKRPTRHEREPNGRRFSASFGIRLGRRSKSFSGQGKGNDVVALF